MGAQNRAVLTRRPTIEPVRGQNRNHDADAEQATETSSECNALAGRSAKEAHRFSSVAPGRRAVPARLNPGWAAHAGVGLAAVAADDICLQSVLRDVLDEVHLDDALDEVTEEVDHARLQALAVLDRRRERSECPLHEKMLEEVPSNVGTAAKP